MSRDFVLVVAAGSEAAGDAALSEVFGDPQLGSFTRDLSPTGADPATHRGAYARGITDEQADLLNSSESLQAVEGSWADGLASLGLQAISQEAS